VEVAERFMEVLNWQGFQSLGISVAHGRLAGLLPGEHRDPFDRMLIAQAQIEGVAVVSNERLFDRFGVRRMW
jgi:PIN domain nuclease of toxin-antitoxin system